MIIVISRRFFLFVSRQEMQMRSAKSNTHAAIRCKLVPRLIAASFWIDCVLISASRLVTLRFTCLKLARIPIKKLHSLSLIHAVNVDRDLVLLQWHPDQDQQLGSYFPVSRFQRQDFNDFTSWIDHAARGITGLFTKITFSTVGKFNWATDNRLVNIYWSFMCSKIHTQNAHIYYVSHVASRIRRRQKK